MIKIFTDSGRRNVVACVDAPTVNPSWMVMVSISGPRAVSAKRRVTPDSFNRFPGVQQGEPGRHQESDQQQADYGEQYFFGLRAHEVFSS